MTSETDQLREIESRNFLGQLAGYAKLSGPGWLQAAVTLGGGSLAGALYLGVIAGYSLMWLQPLAMLCGVIMLGALAHVTLSSSNTPFDSVNRHISPVLAWGWLLATVLADIVFCTAQASLGVATLRQNLGLAGVNPYIITAALSLIAFSSATLYALGSSAMAKLELILKILVAMVMISFAASAGVLLFNGRIDLTALFQGFIPNPSALFRPAGSLDEMIAATGEAATFWNQYVIDQQRDRVIAAFGTAVGINMVFLLPYTIIKRGWTKAHRRLSRFDLVLALFFPFSIATALLVISSASAFHANDNGVLDEEGNPLPSLEAGYYKILDARLESEGIVSESTTEQRLLANQLPLTERQLAAALTNRDAKQLAATLSPLMGSRAANLVFGVGILSMALSTMMVHMLMNGFAISQAVGKLGAPLPFIVGAAMPAILAIFAPLAWTGGSKTALLIPAAVIATVFLPIAYLAILLLINSRSVLLEKDRPSLLVNLLMVLSAGVACFASTWLLINRGPFGWVGLAGLVVLAIIGIAGFVRKQSGFSGTLSK
ncbi:MAG: divalent metal cation transporter [Verrucomicrobiota bacterium]